jgi:sugar/nucleoside kinase (ribokinase family)
MRARSVCDPLERRDLSGFPDSDAVHIGPVLNDIAPSLASHLARRDVVLSLDPQGYVRTLATGGGVRIKKRWRNSPLLSKVTVLKASRDELRPMVGESISANRFSKLGPDIVLLTEGGRGLTVWSKQQGVFRAPAFKTQVKDPTGAGDALVGAFTVTWVRTNDLEWSAAVGAAAASFVVTKFGPQCFGTRRQVEDRANRILNTIKKV